jgi:hypothetical protein
MRRVISSINVRHGIFILKLTQGARIVWELKRMARNAEEENRH